MNFYNDIVIAKSNPTTLKLFHPVDVKERLVYCESNGIVTNNNKIVLFEA